MSHINGDKRRYSFKFSVLARRICYGVPQGRILGKLMIVIELKVGLWTEHIGAIHKRRPLQRGEGVWQKRTLLLIFACKRPKYADTVHRGEGGSKIGQILRMSFMDGPIVMIHCSNL